ncbi:MAG: hypothetical protein AAF577_17610 [Pseudomonadota bacterium]
MATMPNGSALCLARRQIIGALLVDGGFALAKVALAGFGRAVAEVGAVIVVGGNIDHLTRVMTTALTLGTSRDDDLTLAEPSRWCSGWCRGRT